MSVKGKLSINGQVITSGFETVTGGMNCNGLQIRYGNKSVSDSVSTSVTFDTAFPNACIGVLCTCNGSSYGAASNIAVSDWTKTGFKVYQVNTAQAGMYMLYIAFGY